MTFVLVQLLMFGFGADKTTLFTLLISLVACFFSLNSIKNIIVPLFALLCVAVFIEIYLLKSIYIGAIIVNRICFIPSLLSSQYFDFFSNHHLLFWKESVLRYFGFSTGYNTEIAFIISKVYLGKEIVSSNNGLCGDAFANFGWGSLIIFPVLISVLLKFFDSVSYDLNHKIIFIVSIILSLGLINIPLFGLLLTNGFLFLIILLFLLPRTK
jgi:hypothetical protein